MRAGVLAGFVAIAIALAACFGGDQVGTRRAALDGYCEVTVIGVGVRAVETDYLPHVVNCENGGAGPAALEAQAISARSYLYYKLDNGGTISDGTGDQVYSCGREPGPEHYAAVDATAGQVLQYQAVQVAAFYVAGAHQDPPSCQGGSDDPTNTERYVTYNLGNSGDDVVQTSLGWVDPGNYANRGCMSQNGSDCLADAGWQVGEILRFYYGEDIERVQAVGPCIDAPAPDAGGGERDAGTSGDGGIGSGDAGIGGGGEGGLLGGCAVGGTSRSPGLGLLLLALLFRRRRRRQRKR